MIQLNILLKKMTKIQILIIIIVIFTGIENRITIKADKKIIIHLDHVNLIIIIIIITITMIETTININQS